MIGNSGSGSAAGRHQSAIGRRSWTKLEAVRLRYSCDSAPFSACSPDPFLVSLARMPAQPGETWTLHLSIMAGIANGGQQPHSTPIHSHLPSPRPWLASTHSLRATLNLPAASFGSAVGRLCFHSDTSAVATSFVWRQCCEQPPSSPIVTYLAVPVPHHAVQPTRSIVLPTSVSYAALRLHLAILLLLLSGLFALLIAFIIIITFRCDSYPNPAATTHLPPPIRG